MSSFRVHLALCLLALTASTRVLADYYNEDYGDEFDQFVDDYDYDAEQWAQSYDYSSEDQATECVELEDGTFEVSNEIDKCDFKIDTPVGILQDGVAPISGLYKMSGCRKGYPFYMREFQDAEDAPMMLWFSPEYSDWSISGTAKKELAAKTRYLVAYADYKETGSLMLTGQWHVVRSLAATEEFYHDFDVACNAAATDMAVDIEPLSDEFSLDSDQEAADVQIQADVEGKVGGWGLDAKPEALYATNDDDVTYAEVEDAIEEQLDQIEDLLEATDVSNAVKAELEDEAAELEDIEADLADGVNPAEVLQEVKEEEHYVDEAVEDAEEDQVINTIYNTIEDDLDTIDTVIDMEEVAEDLKEDLEYEAEELEDLEYDLDAGANPDDVIEEVLEEQQQLEETLDEVKDEEAEILYEKLDEKIDEIDDALTVSGLDYVTVEELEDQQDALFDLEDSLDAGTDPLLVREDVKAEEEGTEELLDIVEEEAEVNELSEALENSIEELEEVIAAADDVDIEVVEALVDEEEALEDLQYELEAGADPEQLYDAVMEEQGQADDLVDAVEEAIFEGDYADEATAENIMPTFCKENAGMTVAGANLEDCDVEISVPTGLFAETVGEVSGVYKVAGCRDGYPYYQRQSASDDAPRMLWFSTNYGDWSISEASDKSQADEASRLMAWGGADDLDIVNIMPGFKWHVVKSFNAGGDYYNTFNVKCASTSEMPAPIASAVEKVEESTEETETVASSGPEPQTPSANGILGMGGLVLLGFVVAAGFVVFKSCGPSKPKYEKIAKTGHMV